MLRLSMPLPAMFWLMKRFVRLRRLIPFVVFVLALAFSGYASAQESDTALSVEEAQQPYALLLKFYDDNERAIAYHRYCVSNREFPPQSFIDNMNVVAVELQKQLRAHHPEKTAAEIERGLIERARYLQRLNTQIMHDQGCFDRWADIARRHYDIVTALDNDLILDFIARRAR
jgi:hypothetical protein